MTNKMVKINILTIAGTGVMMLLTGLLLILFQDSIAEHRRFFLPIPPLGVAAYVFVFNVFDHYQGGLPETLWLRTIELLAGTVVAATIFFVFSLLLAVSVNQLK